MPLCACIGACVCLAAFASGGLYIMIQNMYLPSKEDLNCVSYSKCIDHESDPEDEADSIELIKTNGKYNTRYVQR